MTQTAFATLAFGLLLAACGGAAAQTAPSGATAPDTGYRAGTVPVTGADATTGNLGTPGVAPGASGPEGAGARSTMGGFGPITTDNGVARSGTPAASAASAPAPRRHFIRPTAAQRAASASGAAKR